MIESFSEFLDRVSFISEYSSSIGYRVISVELLGQWAMDRIIVKRAKFYPQLEFNISENGEILSFRSNGIIPLAWGDFQELFYLAVAGLGIRKVEKILKRF